MSEVAKTSRSAFETLGVKAVDVLLGLAFCSVRL